MIVRIKFVAYGVRALLLNVDLHDVEQRSNKFVIAAQICVCYLKFITILYNTITRNIQFRNVKYIDNFYIFFFINFCLLIYIYIK